MTTWPILQEILNDKLIEYAKNYIEEFTEYEREYVCDDCYKEASLSIPKLKKSLAKLNYKKLVALIL